MAPKGFKASHELVEGDIVSGHGPGQPKITVTHTRPYSNQPKDAKWRFVYGLDEAGKPAMLVAPGDVPYHGRAADAAE